LSAGLGILLLTASPRSTFKYALPFNGGDGILVDVAILIVEVLLEIDDAYFFDALSSRSLVSMIVVAVVLVVQGHV
jgi:hypothetical protein